MNKILRQFNRYVLLDQIAESEGAEVFRARLLSGGIAGRLLALKCARTGFAGVSSLNEFRTEAQCLMNMSHPSIVQLHDFGEEQGRPFLAVEYVSGRTLWDWQARCIEMQAPLPVGLAIHVGLQIASALQYVHSFSDPVSGKHLKIVHRDLSPQNVMISFEGQVKIIDFGIARNVLKTDQTRVGEIKGRPSYISPEQARQEALDSRSDVYSLGILLWELFVNRRLFIADSPLAVFKMITDPSWTIPLPTQLRKEIPEPVERIILQCLQRDRSARFQTAEQVRTALHHALLRFAPGFDPNSLSDYSKYLFHREYHRELVEMRMLNEEAEILARSLSGSSPAGAFRAPSPALAHQEPPTASLNPSQLPFSLPVHQSAPSEATVAPDSDATVLEIQPPSEPEADPTQFMTPEEAKAELESKSHSGSSGPSIPSSTPPSAFRRVAPMVLQAEGNEKSLSLEMPGRSPSASRSAPFFKNDDVRLSTKMLKSPRGPVLSQRIAAPVGAPTPINDFRGQNLGSGGLGADRPGLVDSLLAGVLFIISMVYLGAKLGGPDSVLNQFLSRLADKETPTAVVGSASPEPDKKKGMIVSMPEETLKQVMASQGRSP